MTRAVPTVRVSTMRKKRSAVSGASGGKAPYFWNRKTKPTASISAKTTVKYRVYWLTFFCPAGPSFMSASRRGLTMVSNCMMIDAVI